MELTGTQGRCPSEPVVAEIAHLWVDAPTQFILQKWRVLLLRRILERWEPHSENSVSQDLSGAYTTARIWWGSDEPPRKNELGAGSARKVCSLELRPYAAG